jgi:hypothetical protein
MKEMTNYRRKSLLLLLAGLCCLAGFAGASAQLRFPRESQKTSLTQTIGVTDVTIIYSRPAVKGRKIWGDPPAGATGTATLDNSNTRPKDAVIVPYGHVWRTGANEATTFAVTDEVLINGQKLAAGTYSLHTIPGPTEWTIIFNSDAGQWGSFQYDEKKDTLRVKAKPMMAPMQETLLFTAADVAAAKAVVTIHWEKIAVPFTVEIADLNATVLAKTRAALANAKADDWASYNQAAGYYLFQAKTNTEEAWQWLEKSISIKETFQNMGAKARGYAAMGKTAEAIAAGERAIELGKAAKANTSGLERLVAEWKAKK